MKKFIVSMSLVFTLSAVNIGGAAATVDEAKKAPSTVQVVQQEKMKACNKEAKDKALQGDERKKFIRDCLKK